MKKREVVDRTCEAYQKVPDGTFIKEEELACTSCLSSIVKTLFLFAVNNAVKRINNNHT